MKTDTDTSIPTTQRPDNQLNHESTDRQASFRAFSWFTHGGTFKREKSALASVSLQVGTVASYLLLANQWPEALQHTSTMFRSSNNLVKQASQRGAIRVTSSAQPSRLLSTSTARLAENEEAPAETRQSRMEKLLLEIPPEYNIPGLSKYTFDLAL